MPDKDKIQQALIDFDVTIKAKPNLSDKELLSKFPEFDNDINKLQAAKDYSATLNSGKYKDPSEFNSKFPEFFAEEVKKKDIPSQSSATKLPLPNQPINPLQQGANIVGGGVISDISSKAPKGSIKEAALADKKKNESYLGALWNNAVGSLSRLAGGVTRATYQLSGNPVVRMERELLDKAGKAMGKNLLAEREKEISDAVKGVVEKGRTSASSKEYERKIAEGFDVTNSLGVSDLKGAIAMIPQFAADMGLAIATGGSSFAIQGYDDALSMVDEIDEGRKMSEGTRIGFGLGGAVIFSVLDKLGLDNLVKTPAAKKYVTAKVIKEATEELAKKGAKVTAEQFENTVKEKASKLTRKELAKIVAKKGVKGAGVEGVTESAQEGGIDLLKIAANRLEGSQIFDEEEIKNTAAKRYINSLAAGGILGGGGATVAARFQNTEAAIKSKLAKAQTVEDIDVIVGEINENVVDGSMTQEEADNVLPIVQNFVEVSQKIPETLSGKNKVEAVDLISEREKLQDQLKDIEAQKEALDPAFHNLLDKDAKQIEERVNEINKELVGLALKPQEEVVIEEFEAPKVEGTEPKISQPIELSPELPIEEGKKSKIYHGADIGFTIEGKKNRIMFASKDKNYAKYYADQRAGKVFEFDVEDSKIAKEQYVKDKIKELDLKTEEGNDIEIEDHLHRLIDPRFDDTSISKEGLDKLFSELESEGYYGVKFMDENQDLGGKNEIESIAIFNPKQLTKSNEQNKEQPVKEQKVFAQKDLDRAKAKKIHQRVKEMEAPTNDASQIALRYIADGGKVSESAINEVAGSVKRARLNTGAKDPKSNEAKAKDYYQKDGETLDELAHRLWENSGQEVSEIDIKDALMEVIGGYNTRLEAGTAYLEQYNLEYQEELYYERLAEQYKEEFEAEQKRIEELFKEPLEEEILGLASEEHINNLIQQYENELNRENQNNESIGEADANKKIGSRASGEENGNEKGEVNKQPIREAEGEDVKKVESKETPKKISDKAREQAAKLRSGEANVLPEWLRANLPKGTKKQGADINEVYAKALEVFAETYDKLNDFKKAVDEAFKGISDWFKQNNIDIDEADFKAKFEAQLKGEQVEEALEERRFTKQMLATEGLIDKERLADTLKYIKQTNALSIEEANKIIDEIGLDEAFILVQSDAEMNGGVRGVLSQMLISRYNNLARTATNKADKQFYWDKTIEVANFVTKKLATESGRIIQSFSIWSKLSPEALIRSAVKDMEAQGEFAKKKAKADVDKIGNKLKKANEEAIDEVLESEEFKGDANKAQSKSKSKAEAKIKAAREKRKNIINKYKGKGGITFTSGGITKEGIEFIGEMAKTYIEEGLANIELIVEKIAENIKEVSGKDATDEVLAEVQKIAEKKLTASDTKLIGKGLSDMKVKIADVVKKHFIEAELVKTKLAEKLVSEAGLDGEEAIELANKVRAAFDRIATKKKNQILKDELERLERAKNKLKGTVEVKTRELYDDIIRLTNLGGFENDQILDLLANKVGTGKLTREQGERLQFLAQKVKEAPQGSPKNEAIQELFNYQANLKGTSKGEVGQAIWYASLLAGYKTHIKNIVANVFNTIGETTVSAIENPKAASAMVRGLFKGYQRGLVEARNTLKTGKSPIHITKIEASDVLERKPFAGGNKNPFNWLKYVSRFMVASDVFAFQGLKESRAYQMAYMEAAKMKKEDAALKDVSIWKIINDKLLDTPERKKEAELRVKAEGQVGVEAKRRMYELMEQSRPEKMQDETYNYAARGTFNYQPEGTLGAINNALAYVLDIPIGGVKPLRFVVPFTRILTNVANNALDYEPITSTIRAVRSKRGFESFETMTPTKGTFREMTPEERKRQIIKAGIGVTALSTLYFLSKMKDEDDEPILEITGSGSQDYVKTNQLKERGWKPYSVKIGDTYYSYELTPLLLTLGYIGNLNDFEKYDAKSDAEVVDKMSQTAFRMQDAISNMIFIGTLADFMDMGWDNTKTRGQKVQRYLENLAKTSVPFMQPVTQISQGVQEVMELPKKETTKLGYSLIKDIPIARSALYNKVNVLGEEIPTKSGLIISKKTTNDVWEFLENNRIFLAPINRKTIIGYDEKLGQDMPVTDEQFYKFSKLRGQMIKSVIESIKKNNGLTVLVNGEPVKKTWKQLNSGDYKQEVDAFLEKKTAEATKKAKQIIFTQKEKNEDLEENKKLRDEENAEIGNLEQ